MQEMYPIQGLIKIPLMIVEWFIFFTCLEVAFILIVKYVKNRREKENFQDMGYGFFFLGYGMHWLIKIIADYYFQGEVRLVLLNAATWTLLTSMIGF